MPEALRLAREARCAMVAPAGCGKTEIIAKAVALHGGGRRSLVLTHTHAGVDALRSRLRRFGASAGSHHVHTIAGWALRLAVNFPATSGVRDETPATDEQWSAVYMGAARLLALRPLAEVIRSSYEGVYVDEYQDCSVEQHSVVRVLADLLPCRLVGDPLQGIYAFRGTPVSWTEHVAPTFTATAGPVAPRRWERTNPALGAWLQHVRVDIEVGRPFDLRDGPVKWVPGGLGAQAREITACRAAVVDGENAAVILRWPNEAHALSQRLGGQYSCIEPVESNDLFRYAVEIDAAEGPHRAAKVLEFAKSSLTKIATPMASISAAFEKGREPTRAKKWAPQRDALVAVARTKTPESVLEALEQLQRLPGAHPYRRELLGEMRKALRAVAAGEHPALEAAARSIRQRTRVLGRTFPRMAVGTTLLVKGLEFDHAVVLRADRFDAKNLYVALTRACRSLTVSSESPILRPQ